MDSPKNTIYEPDYLRDGLRVLARMIVRELVAKGESGSESKQDDGSVTDE